MNLKFYIFGNRSRIKYRYQNLPHIRKYKKLTLRIMIITINTIFIMI